MSDQSTTTKPPREWALTFSIVYSEQDSEGEWHEKHRREFYTREEAESYRNYLMRKDSNEQATNQRK